MAFESRVEEKLDIPFRNHALLREAFVHRSYLNENPSEGLESNERLEFFGDSVIGYVVAERLFADCPDCDEGKLTEWRGYLVRGESLARFARELGLGEFLLLGRGEESAGGRERAANLAGVFEAVTGAVALDAGLEAARDFIFRAVGNELDLTGRPTPVDPKSRLQEIVQSKYQRAPAYRTVKEEGPEHRKVFTIEVHVQGEVVGTGVGLSKQEAERKAARQAIDRLDLDPDGALTFSQGQD